MAVKLPEYYHLSKIDGLRNVKRLAKTFSKKELYVRIDETTANIKKYMNKEKDYRYLIDDLLMYLEAIKLK